jgi:anaerobic selenocysteine-containing dehydrogenase
VADGEPVTLTSRVGAITVPAEITDSVMPGAVCLPHGFGHDRAPGALRWAGERPGASYNDLCDDAVVEPLSSVAVFSGVPVTLTRTTTEP